MPIKKTQYYISVMVMVVVLKSSSGMLQNKRNPLDIAKLPRKCKILATGQKIGLYARIMYLCLISRMEM